MLSEIIGVFIVIFSSAVLGSMIGVGGGFLIVPLLTLGLGIPIHNAIALSLLSIIAVASSATITYASSGYIDYKLGLILETTTVLGAFTGARICILLSPSILMITFGVLLIYVGYRMIKKIEFKEAKLRELPLNRLLAGIISSFFAGLSSGLLGIGGGILKVPIMVLILGMPTRVAIGTSEFMISITSASGSYVYYKAGILNTALAGSAIIGGFLGAQLGSRLGIKIRVELIRMIFGFIMLIFSMSMILRGLGIWI
ncbi:sulfite exporter TauE/SafE family protein [Candidatus Geothermarchaeota archaeon]|nr:MAG: sulfite exporter TauE/SafE family protein [Candidatus Geothermarchaeota archaeon]HEW94389.1 sulfite exporter TauE/SafE family protein [Thermoprotei archaeon]